MRFIPALSTAIFLALTGSAFAGAITPEAGGSPNADDIDFLYKVTLAIGAVIFVLVMGVLLYSIFKFRESKGAVAVQSHGNTKLEIGWTIGAALIVVVLSIITFAKLGDIKNPSNSTPGGLASVSAGGNPAIFGNPTESDPPDGSALHIKVTGRQYLWYYTYPNGAVSYDEMVVPQNTTVILDIESIDVIHSWWIPKLGGKFDAVPGYENETWFRADKPGTYEGQCAELCGRNHANMLARVKVIPPQEYLKWVNTQKSELKQAVEEADKQRPQMQR